MDESKKEEPTSPGGFIPVTGFLGDLKTLFDQVNSLWCLVYAVRFTIALSRGTLFGPVTTQLRKHSKWTSQTLLPDLNAERWYGKGVVMASFWMAGDVPGLGVFIAKYKHHQLDHREDCECEVVFPFLRRNAENEAKVQAFVDKACEKIDPELWIFQDHWFRFYRTLSPASPKNLVLPEGLYEGLRDKIQTFRQSRHLYEDRGLAWNLRILIHGPPGTGKTTLIRTLAQGLGLHIISSSSLSKESFWYGLATQIQELQGRALVVVDDLDRQKDLRIPADKSITVNINAGAATPPRESGEALSEILNRLDGSSDTPGLVLLATCNDLSVLEPAVLDRFELIKLDLPDRQGYEKLWFLAFASKPPEPYLEVCLTCTPSARVVSNYLQNRTEAQAAAQLYLLNRTGETDGKNI